MRPAGRGSPIKTNGRLLCLAMGRLIEQTKAKIKKDNLTPEQCQKMFEDEKGVLKSYLLMRAVFELQQEGK